MAYKLRKTGQDVLIREGARVCGEVVRALTEAEGVPASARSYLKTADEFRQG